MIFLSTLLLFPDCSQTTRCQSKKTILKEYWDEIEKLRRDLRAAREKNGVIISEESHEEFQRNAEKVNELEQQLNGAVDRLRRYTEDLLYMVQLYERNGELESRLRESRREYAEKVVELAETNDVLNKHIEAIGVMRKVDDMGAADDRNKDIFDAFVRKAHAARSEELSKQLTEKLAEIKQQVAAFADDVRPLLTEIRNTTSDSFEKRVQQSDKNAAEAKKTCSGMAETLKMLMQHVEQLSVKAEENHQRQLIDNQNTQESILSTINAAENVVQSVEDVIEECC
ncbi:hypothetical protein B9Z55_000112 [Caenorhabditis nigoni]|uniref:Uncharacterized protein n=1 Tax=Caenorhabditis nigoni TaxID=1611254 RepID=A0A2G5VE61_9PELO|nr:hypothetical protein B9Z55_000112 [Caenorhabditis nigoni]